jgi:L-2,4-diaminobutyric acid acetyltransferase
MLLRPPTPADAAAITRLVHRCRPLDPNSTYAYLLLSHHFHDTCVVAERGRTTVGFVSAYVPPRQQDTIFVWQVAVDATAQGEGLAGRLLDELLARDACAGVSFLETTVTPSNLPSRKLFDALTRRLLTACQTRVLFPPELFNDAEPQESPDGEPAPRHEAEELLRIGPFSLSCMDVRSHSGGNPTA